MEMNIFVDILQCFDTAVWAYCFILLTDEATGVTVVKLVVNNEPDLGIVIAGKSSRCVCFSVLFCLEGGRNCGPIA